MKITDIYTLKLHDKITAAFKNDKKLRITNHSDFIKHVNILTVKGGRVLIIKYNTEIPSHTGMTKDNFLSKSYDDMIEGLTKVYEKTQADNIYRLAT